MFSVWCPPYSIDLSFPFSCSFSFLFVSCPLHGSPGANRIRHIRIIRTPPVLLNYIISQQLPRNGGKELASFPYNSHRPPESASRAPGRPVHFLKEKPDAVITPGISTAHPVYLMSIGDVGVNSLSLEIGLSLPLIYFLRGFSACDPFDLTCPTRWEPQCRDCGIPTQHTNQESKCL